MRSTLLSLLCVFSVHVCLGKMPQKTGSKSKFSPGPKPFVFLENKGQLVNRDNKPRNDIDYKLSMPGMNIAIAAGMIQYQWNKTTRTGAGDEEKTSLSIYSLDVFLDGANENAAITREDSVGYYENYYLPQCPDGFTAHAFEKITYHNIYPKIDWVLYSVNNTLKYDFVVHPGGNVADIKLKFAGDSSLAIKDGVFTAYTPYGNITENAPYAYDVNMIEGKEVRKDVAVKFVLEDNMLKFDAGRYDGTLIIDPTVRWSGYFGGSGHDMAYALTCQNDFLIDFKFFIAGSTVSYNIFTDPNVNGYVHQSQNAELSMNSGLEDAFIAAFNQNGGAEWITYYGGSDKDEFRSMVYSNGYIYLAGNTRSSAGVVASPGTQLAMGGGPATPTGVFLDGLLVKFDSDGYRQWGTYIGGNHWDRVWGMGIDKFDNIYITGETYSTNNIATLGSYRVANSSSFKDAFLVKYNSAGQKLWGTYYGDDEDDFGTAVTCDRYGNVYLAGYTRDDTCGRAANPAKDTAMVTPGGHKTIPGNIVWPTCPFPFPFPDPPHPIIDGFLVKFTSAGERLWGTYYGGIGNDIINCIAYDSTVFVDDKGDSTDGLIYIAGSTTSETDIATPNGWQTDFVVELTYPMWYLRGQDGFVAAFKTSGKQYWATYLGVYSLESVNAIDIDAHGSLLVAGETQANGLATPDAVHTTNNGPAGTSDIFFAIFNQAAKVYGTYLGGNKAEIPAAIINNDENHVYIAGRTLSPDAAYHYMNTNQLHGPTHHGIPPSDFDALVLRIDPEMNPLYYQFTPANLAPPFPTNMCPGKSYTHPVTFFPQNMTNPFLPGNTFIVQMSDSNLSFENLTVIDSGSAVPKWTIPKNTPPGPRLIRMVSTRPLMISLSEMTMIDKIPYPQIISDSVACEGDTLWLTTTDTIVSGPSYRWEKTGDTLNLFTQNAFISPAKTSHSGTYIINATLGACAATDTIEVIINPKPAIPVAISNSPICAGQILTLSSGVDTTGGVSVLWTGPGFVSNDVNVSIPGADATRAGVYTATITRQGCSSFDTTTVVVAPQPVISSISSNSPVCFEDTVMLFSSVDPATSLYTWTGPNALTSTSPNPFLLSASGIMNGYYKLEAVLGNCKASDSVLVTVMQLLASPSISTNSPVKEGDELRFSVQGMAGATYSWTGPDGFTSTQQNPAIAKVSTKAAGTYVLGMKIDGCNTVGTTIVIILENKGGTDEAVSLYPNPNDGTFTVKATVKEDQTVPIEVINDAGQVVYRQALRTMDKSLEEIITLPGGLAAGGYQLRIHINNKTRSLPFIIKM